MGPATTNHRALAVKRMNEVRVKKIKCVMCALLLSLKRTFAIAGPSPYS